MTTIGWLTVAYIVACVVVVVCSATFISDRRAEQMAAERRRRDAEWVAQVDDWNRPEHVHGACCHPSADGCPERPGM